MQKDNSNNICKGYKTEAVNSCRVHFVDPSAKEELVLEKEYAEKAALADDRGFFKLASALRDLSKQYHREAIQNIEEEKSWSQED